MASQTVFVQFTYCPLCQLNHKKGKKHAFSKRHQEIVANILKKFEKKIAEAKACLSSPFVQADGWAQQNAMFWCYFCQMEVTRHSYQYTIHGDCIAVNGGMLEHLTRSDHSENTVKFLRENLVDVKKTKNFTLASKDYLKYLEETEKTCLSFLAQKAAQIQKEAAKIRHEELQRHGLVTSTLLQQTMTKDDKGHASEQNSTIYGLTLMNSAVEVERKKTARAFGEGLTTVDRSQEDDSLGNIYTNAVPPWLIPEVKENQDGPVTGIKPDLADLEKHKKQVEKSKLNPHRVGAKFNHQDQKSESWLPNFGGVWSLGRRTKSGERFQKRTFWKGKVGTSSATSTQTASHWGLSNFEDRNKPQHTQSDLLNCFPLRKADDSSVIQQGMSSSGSGDKESLAVSANKFSLVQSVSRQYSSHQSHSESVSPDRSYNTSDNSHLLGSSNNPFPYPAPLNGCQQSTVTRSSDTSSHHYSTASTNIFKNPSSDNLSSNEHCSQFHNSTSTSTSTPGFSTSHFSTPLTSAETVIVKPYTRKRRLPIESPYTAGSSISTLGFSSHQSFLPTNLSTQSSSIPSSWSSQSQLPSPSCTSTSKQQPLRLLPTPVLDHDQVSKKKQKPSWQT